MAEAQGQPTLINSVVRALTLLDAVGTQSAAVPAKKLARLVGLPLGTTYHLLRTLVHEGFLDRVEGGYVLGDRVDALAQRRTGTGSGGRAHRVLRQLHDELGAAAYLSVLDDDCIRLVDVADSPEAPRTDMWVGFEDAAHATALGKAVLAALPDEARTDYLATHPLVDLTPSTLTSRRLLLAQLEESPELTVDREEYAVGVTCLAVPVQSRRLTGAVAVSVPVTKRATLSGSERALRRAARMIALSADA
ncbi:MAG: IclR family transcriptional regulator C-terminal domain-containing protein [Propionicimonas sp.]